MIPAEWDELLRAGGAARVGTEDVRDADLEAWAVATDRQLVTLDTQDCDTEPELLATFGATFDLDEDEDREWDRIDECLADYDVAPASGLVVVWTGWDGLDDDPDHVLPIAVDALVTAARTWADEGRPWAILVVGDGPSWDLPWHGVGPAPWDHDASDEELDDEELADEELDDGDEIADDSLPVRRGRREQRERRPDELLVALRRGSP